ATLSGLAGAKRRGGAGFQRLLLELREANVTARHVEALCRAVNATARAEATSPAPLAQSASTQEEIDDPHRLARAFLAERASGGVRYFREHFHLYDGRRWRQRPDHEMKAGVVRFVKAEVDRRTRQLGMPVVPKVTTALAANVLLALAGDTLLDGGSPWPCWLGHGEPARKNWIALDNGILDVDAFL